MPQWTDERVDRIMGNLLRAGVLLAAALVLAGGVFYVMHYGGHVADRHIFRGEPARLRTVPGIFSDAAALRSRGLIQLGLLLLILTPVARVAFSIFAFARIGDRLYIVITAFVLSVLLFSLASGYLGVL